MESTYVSMEDAKLLYPDEWLILGNPVSDENGLHTLGGHILYHAKSKKEVCIMGRDLTDGYDRITLKYTGKFERRRRLGVMIRINR